MFVYDLETYPNCFLAGYEHVESGRRLIFEISDRVNMIREYLHFLKICATQKQTMVGFYNLSFDEAIVNCVFNTGESCTSDMIFNHAQSVISSDRNFKQIPDWQRIHPQIDLFKINHFDNPAKSTSLKMLEFVMRMDDIQELPYPVGSLLSHDEIDNLIKYLHHDLNATVKFFHKNSDAIKLRTDLTQKHNFDFMNASDTKIGTEYFRMKLEEKQPGICGTRSRPRQTIRRAIPIGEIILPYLGFQRAEFRQIKDWFADKTITETKGVFKDAEFTIDGFKYVFGAGGIHGSIKSGIVRGRKIIDLDVTSFYPSLAIVNDLYPAHLSQTFCETYKEIFDLRAQRPKKQYPAENAMLKLALNGVYGNSNNQYSCFYDPQFTMSITINGQLSLLMLAEWLTTIESLEVIQVNTDGITVAIDDHDEYKVEHIKTVWEKHTRLSLERKDYSRMFIRDVNNYIAEGVDGSIKRKGAYEYERGYHQDHSALVVPKVAEQHLLHGADITHSVVLHDDILDFMLRTKIPRTSKLLYGDEQIQRISRYYVSNAGKMLTKVMPPLSKKPDVERRIGINVGNVVRVCNNLKTADVTDINYKYYIDEVKKLCDPITC